MNVSDMQAIVDRSPFNRWLGMTVQAVGDDSVVLTVTWREEMISSPERQSTHGGILATLIDGAGDYAVATSIGHAVPTLDLRVDYHRVALPGNLRVDARVIHLGGTVATAEARVYDESDRMVASGRALYFVGAKPKA